MAINFKKLAWGVAASPPLKLRYTVVVIVVVVVVVVEVVVFVGILPKWGANTVIHGFKNHERITL